MESLMRKVRTVKRFGRLRRPRTEWVISKFEIAKLELHDGDIVVLRTDMILSKEQVEALRARARENFPGVNVAVLTCGMSLAVLQDKRKRAA
jgi:hypothetical protein